MEEKKIYVCWKCGHQIDMTVKIQRRDDCPSCGNDLHVCKNCRFWDPSYQNECRESISEYIRDREKANHCMHFTFRATVETNAEEAEDARSKLEAMFSKLK